MRCSYCSQVYRDEGAAELRHVRNMRQTEGIGTQERGPDVLELTQFWFAKVLTTTGWYRLRSVPFPSRDPRITHAL